MFLTKKSNGYYYIIYEDFKGKRKSKSTGYKKKSDAFKYLKGMSSILLEQSQSPVNPISLEHFKIKFLAYAELLYSWNHTKSLRTSLNGLQRHFGNIILSSLTHEDILGFIEARMRIVSPYAVKRDIDSLSTAFQWGVSRGHLHENITKGIPKPRLPEKIPIYFSDEEYENLLKVINNHDLLDLVKFAMSTGLRQSDIINLRWEQVNIISKCYLLDNRFKLTKSRKVHVLPLNKTALEILKRRKDDAMLPFVFSYQGKRVLQDFISKKFKKFVIRSGINPSLCFHSLRHTFATRLVKKGIPIYQVSKLLTHADIKTTQIYTHLCAADLFDAVYALDEENF